jgi:Rieske Fe-S protein
MGLNRREFIILTAASAMAAGCQAQGGDTFASAKGLVDAGPVSNYAADGVYPGFRDQGFFVIRSGEKLLALTSVCTHSACRLNAAPDRSFICKCHGSTFTAQGKVTKGPARRDLPELPTSIDERGHLMVQVLST